MKIIVGTENEAKIGAVKEIVKEYRHLKDARVDGVKTDSGVADQPKSLDETIRGAINRAKASFEHCDLSVGIESGLMEVPHTKSGFMDVCACALYDGKQMHLGLSSAWEFPDAKVMRLIIDEGMDMTQAANRAGLTNNPRIGSAEGVIGILTKGKIDRKEYSKQAIRMALIHIDTHD